MALTTLSAAPAAGATNIKIASNAELAVGSVIGIDLGTNTEVRTITSLGTTGANGTGDGITPALGLAHANGATVTLPDTALAAAASAGDATIAVGSAARLSPGETLLIDPGPNAEVRTIQGLNGTSVALNAALTGAHPSGAAFNVLEGQPQGYLADTIEHLNYFAGGAPHGIGGPAQPTEELKRALELPAQWTSLLLAGDDYAGATAKPTTPVAYFETSPVDPLDDADRQLRRGLRPRRGRLDKRADLLLGLRRRHPRHRQDRLAHVLRADLRRRQAGGREERRVGPVPPGGPGGQPDAAPAPATNACGTFTPRESAALIAAASGGGAGGQAPAKSEEVTR